MRRVFLAKIERQQIVWGTPRKTLRDPYQNDRPVRTIEKFS
jgi:hypothetical protein